MLFPYTHFQHDMRLGYAGNISGVTFISQTQGAGRIGLLIQVGMVLETIRMLRQLDGGDVRYDGESAGWPVGC